MSESKTIRINKVLRELNISLDRAVDHLAEHGFEVEARPTSKISQKEYQLLVDSFQTDRTKRVASEEVGEVKRKEKEASRLISARKSQRKVIKQVPGSLQKPKPTFMPTFTPQFPLPTAGPPPPSAGDYVPDEPTR